MLIAFTAASALVPSILIVWFFKTRDAHPEPSSVLWATFFLGVLSIVPTIMTALPVMVVLEAVVPPGLILAVAEAFFTASLPEELFKLCVVLFYCRRHPAFDEPMDGIVYGVVASLGFATFENVLYTAQGGLGVAIARAFTAVPMHAFCGAIMGYYVGQMKFGPPERSLSNLVQAYFWPVMIHGVYDAPLLWMGKASQSYGGDIPDGVAVLMLLGIGVALGTLLIAIVWGLVLVSRLRKDQLRLIEEGQFVLVDDDGQELGPVPVGSFALAQPVEPRPTPQPSSLGAWLLILFGGGLATCGGLVLFGGLLGYLFGELNEQKVIGLVVACAILGLLPLVIGLGMFFGGVRKLPDRPRRRSPYKPTGRFEKDELRRRLEADG